MPLIKKKDKKSITLKTSQTSSHKEESENENEDDNENDNEDVALLAKRFFNQFKKKKSKFYNKDESFA